ncbi:MAG: hypothetical protein A2744_00405 [Candidatus Buchananbacteria bacterium RIFCSPHIGHO2_01_FULL_44_11]|uniref:N-acetyltransferase domain-containing protein n=1 Tax=Candidatus Buchananbacteria bacterium RIFCSPHIGHO2_01_FULL_44_11 TaxID=1797535 RepID=A0A1G1Y0S6_9BACT|nr:MAG: hypothetical protein A2744_00405 [Candidatus Buchananbacteria bacterium RIFCSPHIGHO2_01_FULL_44_11]
MTKPVLKGKKVILRPMSFKDAPDYCRWLADQEVTKFLAIYDNKPPTLKEERQWIAAAKKDKSRVVLAIDTADGRHIGSIALMKIDQYAKRAEYGIMIGDKYYWGQGCGTEAGRLLVNYGFKKLKLHRIELRYIAYNIRGAKSYKKIGFKEEGRLRDHFFREGYWHDEVVMGILRYEYHRKAKK